LIKLPLWLACQNGHLAVVQLLLASGRKIDTKMRSTSKNTTAAEQGRAMARSPKQTYESDADPPRRKTNCPQCANLVDEYEKDRDGVRTRLRRELGLPGSFIFQSLISLPCSHSPL